MNDDIVVQKADSITRLQRPYIKKILRNLVITNPTNAFLITEYIINEETQFNIKESTKEGKIKTLVWLSAYFNNTKSFKAMTKEDILSYLNNLRKPVSEDASQRWIGSYMVVELRLSIENKPPFGHNCCQYNFKKINRRRI